MDRLKFAEITQKQKTLLNHFRFVRNVDRQIGSCLGQRPAVGPPPTTRRRLHHRALPLLHG